MVDFKKALGRKKEEESQDDTILFDLNPEKLQDAAEKQPPRGSVQSFSVTPEPAQPTPTQKPVTQDVQPAVVSETPGGSTAEPTVVNEQLQDLSSNLKNLVYDFRSFMSESGSPFNPNDIPATPEQAAAAGQSNSGYISAKNAGATVTETVDNPSDVQSGLENRFISGADKAKLNRLLDSSKRPSSSALRQFNETLAAHQVTKFSKDLKSNLDTADMPALIRAVNSTDYLLHAVGRKNLLKILEVGTREGWIRPEVERIVLSVAEVLSTAGVEADDRIINVNDLLRVVYFLNKLLDPEISDFLSMNQIPRSRPP
jgi:archaellum component FlaD/FlaE